MATTKKTTTKKETTTKKTTKKAVVNETKVICPVCGSEIDIPEHEHTIKNATAIGKDSGLGTVELPVAKRGQLLQAAGIDTSKYFSVALPTGNTAVMRIGATGAPEPVPQDDPIFAIIIQQGTIPNHSLFRRWIMSQVFRALTCSGGITEWMHWRGYEYQWKMIAEEFHAQAKMFAADKENWRARNRWFDKDLVLKMMRDYMNKLREEVESRPVKKCKGHPYVTVGGKHIFTSDLNTKLYRPLERIITETRLASTISQLEAKIVKFNKQRVRLAHDTYFCPEWADAFKGMGAYATMQNLFRFHDCHFPISNEHFNTKYTDLEMLEWAAADYEKGEGWKLFGLLKEVLKFNKVDIAAKRKEWCRAKKMRGL